MSEATIALVTLVSAMFGGAGLKIIESLLNRASNRADIAQQIRDELRQEVGSLRDQVSSLSDRLDDWRNQYYTVLAMYNELMLIALSEGLEDRVKHLRPKAGD